MILDQVCFVKTASKIKLEIRKERRVRVEEQLNDIRSRMDEIQLRVNEENQQTRSYNWLTTLPLAEFNYNLNKEQFWDALRLRYNWNIPRTPTECACGNKFTVQHALSCEKGGFITLRHNEVDEVCKDARKEPLLTKLTGENID